jgi:hypothetical protein
MHDKSSGAGDSSNPLKEPRIRLESEQRGEERGSSNRADFWPARPISAVKLDKKSCR